MRKTFSHILSIPPRTNCKQVKDRIKNAVGAIRKRSGNNKQLWLDIHDCTSFLPLTAKIKERIYCINNDITSRPVCKHCKTEPVQFLGPSTGYREYCSATCSNIDSEVQQKKKQTCIQNYGVEHPAQSENIRDKMKQTCIQKYGVEHHRQLDGVVERVKQTNLNKFGVPHFSYSHLSDGVINKLFNVDWLTEQHVSKQTSVFEISQNLGVCSKTVLHQLTKHDVPVTKGGKISSGEKQIVNFISKHYDGKIITNDRTLIYPKEIDIYLPELNIAFEYDGLYWHSELSGTSKQYHKNKTTDMANIGIQLYHIFENEWMLKRQLVENKILHLIGCSKQKIYARKCSIVELTNKQANKFIEQYHIQGKVNNSHFNCGLLHNDELVAVCSVGKSRFNSQYEYELMRMCSSVSVVGGMGKLISHVKNTLTSGTMVSYCDRRWGTGQSYLN